MRTTFTAEIRILLCENCGAPLEAPVGGGSMHCTYCRAQNVVETRDERPTLGMPAVPVPIDENERLRRLRSQDGRPMVPPQSLLYLMSGSSFDPSKVQEAFMIYQATRKEVKATHSPDAAERLYFLTLIASNYLTESGDDARRRAILETSLDTLFLPRHKQVIRCQLASSAAKENDIAAAERWLAPCDARSDDLDSDSAYRITRAYIDTVRGDFGAVLNVLGAQDEQVPIADARDPQAAVLRANALERLGHMDAAVTALRSRMQNENAAGRIAIEQYVKLHPRLQLCPQSLPAATRGHAQQAAQVASSGAGGGVGLVLVGVGVLMLLIDVGVLLFGVGPGLFQAVRYGGFSFEPFLAAIGGSFAICLGPTIAACVMIPLGLALWRGAREAAFLRVNGLPARGTVRNVQGTGTKINGVPMMRILVQVQRDGAAPYETSFTQLTPPGLMVQLAPGAQVPLRVHPQKPDKVILELQ